MSAEKVALAVAAAVEMEVVVEGLKYLQKVEFLVKSTGSKTLEYFHLWLVFHPFAAAVAVAVAVEEVRGHSFHLKEEYSYSEDVHALVVADDIVVNVEEGRAVQKLGWK